jgi:hypothetical protein
MLVEAFYGTSLAGIWGLFLSKSLMLPLRRGRSQ